MDIDQAKAELITAFENVKPLLTVANCYLFEDEQFEGDDIRLMLNDCFTPDDYNSEYVAPLKEELDNALENYKNFEFDQQRHSALINWMIKQISVDKFAVKYMGTRIKSDLTNDELILIFDRCFSEFENERKKSAAEIITLLQFYKSDTTTPTSPTRKVKWLGTIIELCELMATLEKQDWIEPFEKGEKLEIVRAFVRLFDISARQDIPDEEKAVESVYRTLNSKMTKRYGEMVNVYDKIYTNNYSPKFEMIKKNKNS